MKNVIIKILIIFISVLANAQTKKVKSLPKYLLLINEYSPKVTTVCQDQAYSDCIRDVSEIIKELIEIRETHIASKNSEKYKSFYSKAENVNKKINWDSDLKRINKYLIENITLYDEAIKECGYDGVDWFDKLPKDLYKHYKLSKTELLNKE